MPWRYDEDFVIPPCYNNVNIYSFDLNVGYSLN